MMNMTLSSPQTLEKISGIDSVTVLLIDDSPDNLMILGDILERIGYQVVCAEDGESGPRTRKTCSTRLDIYGCENAWP